MRQTTSSQYSTICRGLKKKKKKGRWKNNPIPRIAHPDSHTRNKQEKAHKTRKQKITILSTFYIQKKEKKAHYPDPFALFRCAFSRSYSLASRPSSP